MRWNCEWKQKRFAALHAMLFCLWITNLKKRKRKNTVAKRYAKLRDQIILLMHIHRKQRFSVAVIKNLISKLDAFNSRAFILMKWKWICTDKVKQRGYDVTIKHFIWIKEILWVLLKHSISRLLPATQCVAAKNLIYFSSFQKKECQKNGNNFTLSSSSTLLLAPSHLTNHQRKEFQSRSNGMCPNDDSGILNWKR
jgi:hypothetical protein